jgi:hypothetical protein
MVGWAIRHRSDGEVHHRVPWAWSLGDPAITWLPLPGDQRGGIAVDVMHGVVIGMTNDEELDDIGNSGTRGIAWELQSGAFLDLGTGPADLSGTMVTEGGLTPQSMVAGIDGDQVLGFLGEGCAPWTYPSDCGPWSFGGTPIVWDIGDWLASVGP